MMQKDARLQADDPSCASTSTVRVREKKNPNAVNLKALPPMDVMGDSLFDDGLEGISMMQRSAEFKKH